MPAPLPKELHEELMALLLPEMGTVQSRRSTLLPFIDGHPIHHDIEWEGTPREFTTKLIRLLPTQELKVILDQANLGEEKRTQARQLTGKLDSHRMSLNGSLQGGLIKKAQLSHRRLVHSLLNARRSDCLFPSRIRDVSPSSTVSSIAALAISESDGGLQQGRETAEQLIRMRSVSGDDTGAWPPQTGEVFHTIANAWPLFTIARILPHRLRDVEEAIGWLAAKARAHRSGWGFHRKGDVDPFPTAYALNALLAIQPLSEAAGLSSATNDTVKQAIMDGMRFLWEVSAKRDSKWIYWNGESTDENTVCLATSLICYHVFRRHPAAMAGAGLKAEIVRSSIDRMLRSIAQAIATLGMEVTEFTVPLSDGTELTAPAWPVRHVTDGFNYTYAYFTPLIATTLVDICLEEPFKDDLPTIRKACASLIAWIVKNEKDGTLGPSGQGPSIWAAAQGALVLGRIIKAEGLLKYD